MNKCFPRASAAGALAVALALIPAGCGRSGGEATSGARSNKVLKASVSDEMIEYDSLRSEPPPARIESGEDGPGQGVGPESGPASTAAGAAQSGAAETVPIAGPGEPPASED